MTIRAPEIDIDFFSHSTRCAPYPVYQRLREVGPVCKLEGEDIYAVGRFAEIKEILGNWREFSSANGVAMNALMNQLISGTVLASDPPEHKRLRDILGRPLAPARIAALRPRLRQLASAKVTELLNRGRHEAISELAMLLPLNVISELVGLPKEGREQMLDWAAAAFNGMAPSGVTLSDGAFPVMKGMVDYVTSPTLVKGLKADSWASQLWSCVGTGQLTESEFGSIIQGYISPSLDTTIFAVGNLIWLLATNPEEWRKLKDNPAMIPRCINEVLRFESPALGFSRVTQNDVVLSGVSIPKGARIMTVLPSGNRDERRYIDPDRFEISRDASDHLAFGGGIHRCVGGNMAILEIAAVLEAIVDQVETITLHSYKRAENALLRGFEKLEVTFQ